MRNELIIGGLFSYFSAAKRLQVAAPHPGGRTSTSALTYGLGPHGRRAPTAAEKGSPNLHRTGEGY